MDRASGTGDAGSRLGGGCEDPDVARGRALLELLLAWGLAEFAFWYVAGPFARPARAVAGVAIFGVIALSMWRRRLTPAHLLGASTRPRAWGLALGATLLGALAILAAGWAFDLWRGVPTFDFARPGAPHVGRWWTGKLVAVVAQQVVLQGFAYPLFLEILRRRGLALAASAVMFGALHLPNLPLAILSATAAPLWCVLYLRNRSLVPLIASHLALAIVARAACGDAILNMRVGASVLELLPRTLEADDGKTLRVAPLSVEGFVDRCLREGDRVVCEGWSADVDRGAPARELMVMASGGFHRYPLLGSPRPDVADHWRRPEIEACGFRVALPGEWFEEEVRFFGVGEDRTAELSYIEGYDRGL